MPAARHVSLSGALAEIRAHLAQPRFSAFLEPVDRETIDLVITDLARDANPTIDKALLLTSRATANVGYLRAKYDARTREAEQARDAALGQADGRVRQALHANNAKVTEAMVAGQLSLDPACRESETRYLVLVELSAHLRGLQVAVDHRFRALEHLSHNVRQDRRESAD